MFKKKRGVKIMAVILAAAIAMPSAGIALAAERDAVRLETEDSGGTWLGNLIRAVYSMNGGDEAGQDTRTATSTSTNTKTTTGQDSCYEVVLTVNLPAGGFTYGDKLEELITVNAEALEGATDEARDDIEKSFDYKKDCLLKYYDSTGKEVDGRVPKNVGKYTVKAYSTESSRFKSKGAEAEFWIKKKEITIKPVDAKKDLKEFKDSQFPDKWAVELAEGSELAYGETLAASNMVACTIKKAGTDTGIEINDLAAGVYDLVIAEEAKLELDGGAEASNYDVKTSPGKLTIGKKLTLQVEQNKKITYGEFEKAEFKVTAEYDGKTVELNRDDLSFQFIDANGESVEKGSVRNAGTYKVEAIYDYVDDNGVPYWGESGKTAFEIEKRPITVKVEDFEIEKGADLPDEAELAKHLIVEGRRVGEKGYKELPYGEDWEKEPTAKFEENVDPNVTGGYKVLADAALNQDNYALVCEPGTMTVKAAEGEEKKEIKLQLDAVSVVYGDGADQENPSENIKAAVIANISATEADGDREASLQKDKIELTYFDSEKKPLKEAPVDVDEKGFYVKAAYSGDEAYKKCDATDFAELKITKRTISIEAESYKIANDAELPVPTLKTYDNPVYGDKWAEDGEPKAAYEAAVDTKKGGEYVISVSAKVEEAKEKNYQLELKNGTLSVAKLGEGGKSQDILTLKPEAESKIKEGKLYDGKPFDLTALITKESVESKFGYTGEYEYIWSAADTKMENAPTDTGKYTLTIKIPDTEPTWEGSVVIPDIEIRKRSLEVVVKLESSTIYEGDRVKYDVVVQGDGFAEGESWIKEPVVKIGDVNKAGTYKVQAEGGEASNNYNDAAYKETELIVEPGLKTVIDSVEVKLPKKGYTYTGEQICPTVTVKYGKSKLKLNVDYVVEYSNNVNAGKGTVTVWGIGGYAGYFEKEFPINQKVMKKVALSEVGAVKVTGGSLNEILKGTLVVTDGIYEVPSGDYEILVDKNGGNNFVSADQVEVGANDILDKAVLKVRAVNKEGNYTGESAKKVKFVILGSGVDAAPITNISFDANSLRIPAKGYTYNGKAQKPKVNVSGAKSGKDFKVVYKNNVNAGKGEVRIVGVYNKKTGKGYYGASTPAQFDIRQKDISKVKVSAGTAIPKNTGKDDIKLTVKDGKRILTEGRDYQVIIEDKYFVSGRVNPDIKAGDKIPVKIAALGGNYIPGKAKDAFIKFGQLNLASKTAKVEVSMTGSNASDVTVVYNGVRLVQNTDYTVSKIKPGKNGKYTVTIKAAKDKSCVYKGSRTVKNLEIKTATEQ